VETRDAYSNVVLDAELRRRGILGPDAALATQITYGVLRNRPIIDYAADRWLKKPISRLNPFCRAALRAGIFQILFLDRVPPHAAVSETVKLVKRRAVWFTGVANAVLRRVSENRGEILTALNLPVTNARSLGLGYGLPEGLAFDLIERRGLDGAISYAQALQEPPTVTLRVRDPQSRKDCIAALRGTGVSGTETRYSPSGIEVTRGSRPDRLSPVAAGLALIQNEAAQMVSYFADPQPGTRVLDICAGRGGKTFHLADLAGPEAVVIATDIFAGKLKQLQVEADRLGYRNIMTALPEPRELPDALNESADQHDLATKDRLSSLEASDLVLVDAPCSGSGVMRRHPELRWKLTPERLDGLADLQIELLENGACLVKPGGILTYAVCSDLPSEGQLRINLFLEVHDAFERAELPDTIDWKGLGLVTDEGDLLLQPHPHGTDGFYACRLRRVG
jgi:16S rRNA (cytosine967-C5)-methyltransferase